MICLDDRASMTQALAQPLNSRLRPLLERVVASLDTEHGDIAPFTRILVIEPGDTEANIVAQIGLVPLVDAVLDVAAPPLNGLGEQGWLVAHDGWYEMTLTVGDSDFAIVLFIPDVERTLGDFLKLCARFAR